MNLIKNVKITKVKASQATGTTAVDTSILDMQGYEGVVFFGTIGSANAGNFIKAQDGADSGLSDVADLAGSKVVAAADGSTVWLDIYKPLKRYIRAEVVRAGLTTITGDIFAIQYSGRVRPETNIVAGVQIGTLLISPADGTA